MSIEHILEQLVVAWNEQDVETIVATFADDGAYHEPAGPDRCGRTHTGHAAIRRALGKIFHAFPDGRIIAQGPIVVAGEHAHCEWDFEWSDGDGRTQCVRGVDVFTFRGDKLQHKNAYLKQYVAPRANAL